MYWNAGAGGLVVKDVAGGAGGVGAARAEAGAGGGVPLPAPGQAGPPPLLLPTGAPALIGEEGVGGGGAGGGAEVALALTGCVLLHLKHAE